MSWRLHSVRHGEMKTMRGTFIMFMKGKGLRVSPAMSMKTNVLPENRSGAAPIAMTLEPGTFGQCWALAVYPQCDGPHSCPKAQKNHFTFGKAQP